MVQTLNLRIFIKKAHPYGADFGPYWFIGTPYSLSHAAIEIDLSQAALLRLIWPTNNGNILKMKSGTSQNVKWILP